MTNVEWSKQWVNDEDRRTMKCEMSSLNSELIDHGLNSTRYEKIIVTD